MIVSRQTYSWSKHVKCLISSKIRKLDSNMAATKPHVHLIIGDPMLRTIDDSYFIHTINSA
jgi:hypothetical protein